MLVLYTLYTLMLPVLPLPPMPLHVRTRIYFASEPHTIILAEARHTKPKHIPGTPYWVYHQ
jgi:negative modulator of initiation of replication